MPHVPHCHNTYPLIKYLSGLRYLFTFPLFALLIQVSLCQIQCYQRLDAAVSFFFWPGLFTSLLSEGTWTFSFVL